MATNEYAVSASVAVTEQLQQLLATARARGMFPVAVRSFRWVMEELARTPLSFGESRDYLPHLELHLRIAIVGPVAVQFAVHEGSKQVFVRRFQFRG